ncbi:hypothetical protein DPMN_066726 [Dreissena polymorpha]|uniref:Uncharacterized protein n=1 Tax=Dreissena polymorpha TaxID=45954 RepID=A0A9D3YU15_DREPO|nr:hypothetical protein DPMN_066726 [Dreissena polymorpha]
MLQKARNQSISPLSEKHDDCVISRHPNYVLQGMAHRTIQRDHHTDGTRLRTYTASSGSDRGYNRGYRGRGGHKRVNYTEADEDNKVGGMFSSVLTRGCG